jgi:hypothetical protein
MVKKMMKAALACSLVFGLSSIAFAQEEVSAKIGGAFTEYFGQYNSGAKDYAAHFQSIGEANLRFNGTIGKMSVFHEIEANKTKNAKADFNNTKTQISYITPVGKLSLGNAVNIGTIPLGSAGWKTSNVPNSGQRGLVWGGYTEAEALDLVVPLEGMGFIQVTLYDNGLNAASNTIKGIAKNAGVGFSEATGGTSMNVGANLKFGSIGVRGGFATASTDDPTDKDDKPLSSTSMLVGAQIGLGDNMSLAFDIGSGSGKQDGWSDAISAMTTDVAFNMKGLGPGGITVRVDSEAVVWGSNAVYAYSGLSLLFDAPVGKGAGYQFGYVSGTNTPEVGDVVTESYLAGGFYALF